MKFILLNWGTMRNVVQCELHLNMRVHSDIYRTQIGPYSFLLFCIVCTIISSAKKWGKPLNFFKIVHLPEKLPW